MSFNKEDNFFNGMFQTPFRDQFPKMFQSQLCDDNFAREVEVNQTEANVLSFTFDLKEFKVGYFTKVYLQKVCIY